MTTISEIQREAKFQELVVSEQPETGYQKSCAGNGDFIHCLSQHGDTNKSFPEASRLSAISQSQQASGNYGSHVVYPGQSVRQPQRIHLVGKGAVSQWQAQAKNLRQETHTENNQRSLGLISSQPSTGHSIQETSGIIPLTVNTHFGSINQQVLVLNPEFTPAPSSIPQSLLLSSRDNFSSHVQNLCPNPQAQIQRQTKKSSSHTVYPLFQLEPCIEHQGHPTTYCILEGITLSSSPPQIIGPFIAPITQTKANYTVPNSGLNRLNSKSQLQRQHYQLHDQHKFQQKHQQLQQKQQQQKYSSAKYQQISSLQNKPPQLDYRSAPQKSTLLFHPSAQERFRSSTPKTQKLAHNSNNQPFNTIIQQNPVEEKTDKLYPNNTYHYLCVENNHQPLLCKKFGHKYNIVNKFTDENLLQTISTVEDTCNSNITKSINVDAPIHSAWLSDQSLDNINPVQVPVMSLSEENALKNHRSILSSARTDLLSYPKTNLIIAAPLPNTEPPLLEDNLIENTHLRSDSSTSFDFTVEAEKMVSALCNSASIKELENSYHQNGIDIDENKDMQTKERNIVFQKKSEEQLLAPSKMLRQSIENGKCNLSKREILTMKKAKKWAAISTGDSSDDGSSIYSASTIDMEDTIETAIFHSTTECEDGQNLNISPLRLSPSSNSSNSMSKSIEPKRIEKVCLQDALHLRSNELTESSRVQPTESMKTGNKAKTISCQTDALEGVYNEQMMFRETVVKGCHEIGRIINECMTPSLQGLGQLCVDVQEAISKPETLLVSENVQKDLIVGFLKLTNCWLNLYPCLGISQYSCSSTSTLGVEISQLYQNWTCASRKLMEGLIKFFGHKMNECINQNPNTNIQCNPEVINITQAQPLQNMEFNHQVYAAHNEYNINDIQGEYTSQCPSTEFSDIYGVVTTEHTASPLIFSSVPQTEIPAYSVPTSFDMRLPNVNPNHNQNNVGNIHQNHKTNWRIRRFSDLQQGSTGPQSQSGIHKGKGSFQNSSDNSRKWNIGSPGSTASCHSTYENSKYTGTCRDVRTTDDDNFTRILQNDSQSTHNRFNHHNADNKFKQKNNFSGRKTSSKSTNIEIQLRDKALENLDNFAKQWQQQQSESLHCNSDKKSHVEKISTDEIVSVPKNKMIPLCQIEAKNPNICQNQSHPTVDLSSWFQGMESSPTPVDPETKNSFHNSPEIAYADNRNQLYINTEPVVQLNQNILLPSTVMPHHSSHCCNYEDTRNQFTPGKSKTWSNKQNIGTGTNYFCKSTIPFQTVSNNNILMTQQCDEHDSSDDLQDRVYMKPGSYDVPKKYSSTKYYNKSPIIISNDTKNSVSSSPGVVVPFPAAPVVPPPSRLLESNPKILRHIQISKSHDKLVVPPAVNNEISESSEPSDQAWKAACASAETLLEILQQSGSSSNSSQEKSLNEERRTNKEQNMNKNSYSVKVPDNLQQEINDKVKESTGSCKKGISTIEKRKINNVKTDDWLISTLNNMTKLQGDIQMKEKTKVEETITLGSSETSSNNNGTTEDLKITKNKNVATNILNGQKSSVPKNCIGKTIKEKKSETSFPVSKKALNMNTGKKHHESGKNHSDSRKRKLHEHSSNDDHQNFHTNGDYSGEINSGASCSEKSNNMAVTCNSIKFKNDIRNKATWNVWYSSRRRRGLSEIAVNKLEDILNVIWNMEQSDFVKYPVSSNECDDYYKLIKYPMCLETIANKLKNRIYETIEQFVHDFRRVFVNSKLYNKFGHETSLATCIQIQIVVFGEDVVKLLVQIVFGDVFWSVQGFGKLLPKDPVYLKLTEVLETKYNTLLEDHFSRWDFGHITGDPKEVINNPEVRYLAYTDKSTSSKNRRVKTTPKPSTTTTNNPNTKSSCISGAQTPSSV